MKKTVGFVIVFIALFFTSKVQAQFGVQAGYVHMGSKGSLELGQYDHFSGTFRNSGFQVGLTYDFNLKNDFSIQTGLLYSFISGNTTEKNRVMASVIGDFTSSTTYQFVNLPIRLAYSLVVTNDFKFFFFGGPNFSYGLNAKYNTGQMKGKYQGTTTPTILKVNEYNIYDAYPTQLSRFDVKLGAGIGVHYNNYRARAGYDFGILNSYTGEKKKNSAGALNSVRRGELSVSVGYVF